MSAHTTEVLNALRLRVVQEELTPAQRRFRWLEYQQARSKTPGLLLLWHEVLGLGLRRADRDLLLRLAEKEGAR